MWMWVCFILFDLTQQVILTVSNNNNYYNHENDNSSVSSSKTVKIHKYCEIGQVIVLDPPHFDCADVTHGKNWTPFFYKFLDDGGLEKVGNSGTGSVRGVGVGRVDADKLEVLEVEYPEEDLSCNNIGSSDDNNNDDDWEMVKFSGKHNQTNFILLTSGALMWRSERCTCGRCNKWRRFTAPFYIDGLGRYETERNSSGAYHSGQELDQVLYYCKFHFQLESRRKSLNSTRTITDRLFVAILILTAFFYLITTIVYALLWNTQNLPGWTVFSVVLSRTLLSVLACLAFLGKLYRWDVTHENWCTFIAVMSHYFLLSAYAWVTLLNFNLWRTFRTLRPAVSESSKSSNLKSYLIYSGFGWGLPLILVASSFGVDVVLRKNEFAHIQLVPNYGNGICFIVECARGIYVHLFSALFLIPAFIFALLTFYTLIRFRADTSMLRGAKHHHHQGQGQGTNEKTSSYRLYIKILVITSVSWVISFALWSFEHDDDDDDEDDDLQNRHSLLQLTLLGLHWTDVLGSSIFIFIVFACKKSNLTKFAQNYPQLHAQVQSVCRAWGDLKRRLPLTLSLIAQKNPSSGPDFSSNI